MFESNTLISVHILWTDINSNWTFSFSVIGVLRVSDFLFFVFFFRSRFASHVNWIKKFLFGEWIVGHWNDGCRCFTFAFQSIRMRNTKEKPNSISSTEYDHFNANNSFVRACKSRNQTKNITTTKYMEINEIDTSFTPSVFGSFHRQWMHLLSQIESVPQLGLRCTNQAWRTKRLDLFIFYMRSIIPMVKAGAQRERTNTTMENRIKKQGWHRATTADTDIC